MKLATFHHEGTRRVGAVAGDGESIIDLSAAAREAGEDGTLYADMIGLLEAGEEGMARAGRMAEAGAQSHALALSKVKLLAPVPCPRKLFALAGNYVKHIEEFGVQSQLQDTQTPRFFMKPASSTVIGAGDAIRLPPVASAIDWEGELAVVIGRRGKGVKAGDALACVAGYTIMNDVSERKLKIWDRTESRPRDEWFDWLNGKWLDTFAPMGPWLVTRDEIPDPQVLQISTFINGQRKQHESTAQMIFPVARLIEYISTFVTLEPGDVISTGTVAGVGASSGNFLQVGDQVRITIDRIGSLDNTVERSDA
jgi:2-keto-4-pentenoate hydratase/2-oxohepta-3-ene-1,7-dioic acid hydratase in catechol pathway